MKINVELNQKSIQNAVNILKQTKKIVAEKMIPEYIQRSIQWIEKEANRIVQSSDIGDNIKQYIQNSWVIEKVSNSHYMLKNISRHAVFVEFGVGIIGQTEQHPNADNAKYEYNVDSEHKFGQGFWQFTVENQSELDLPDEAIINQTYTSENGLTVITQGTKGVWFLFNAVENFKLKERKRLWEEIKGKYLG